MSLEDIPYCETFYPTKEDFRNFESYIETCEKTSTSGIFKVVAPNSWKPRKDLYQSLDFKISKPVEQVITGDSGLFELCLIQKESRRMSKYKKMVDGLDKLTDLKTNLDIEKMFWKNMKLSSPLYGSDVPGSLFDNGIGWNLAELNTFLQKGLEKGILGVTSPYLYIGAWKTVFAWHKEDMDLYSINYLHLGKPKFWYSVSLSSSGKFEEFMRKAFPEAFQGCSEFLRHKTYLASPVVLLKNGISLHKCVQNPGEFVITKAGAYHCGFNSGFNIAEAVNFALAKWLKAGKQAKPCKCRGDSVKINMEEFISKAKTSMGIRSHSWEKRG